MPNQAIGIRTGIPKYKTWCIIVIVMIFTPKNIPCFGTNYFKSKLTMIVMIKIAILKKPQTKPHE